MSHITIPNADLRQRFQYVLRYGLHVANGNSYGIPAAQAAYTCGEQWYQALLSYLQQNMEHLDQQLKARVPQVKLVRPQATYIPLLDMGELGMSNDEMKEFLVQKVGAALNAGSTFGPGGERFMRINVATQRSKLDKFVDQLSRAVSERS